MQWSLNLKNKSSSRKILWFVILATQVACTSETQKKIENDGIELVVLGTIQDAGSPQIGCTKTCCKELLKKGNSNRKVVSLGVIDHDLKQQYLFEATPNITMQIAHLQCTSNQFKLPDGIFLTHAHIGHYTGLMYLGKEAMNSQSTDVFVMPDMFGFLTKNGPWNLLVENENIKLNLLRNGQAKSLNENLSVTPIEVPHRDEYSETVGFRISGPNKSALFIPDIDKWVKWDRDIIQEINKVDYAFIDGTFFSGSEIGHRNISEIPHPFIEESMNRFESLAPEVRSKIYFIHFNHTNPVLNESSWESKEIEKKGFNLARMSDRFSL